MSRKVKVLLSLAVLTVIVSAGVLIARPAAAFRPPGPLCGWSAIWTCTLPNGDEVQVVGTQCDIARFERKTGATCHL